MNGFDLSTISGIYVGNVQYSSIYYGSTLVWQANTGPLPTGYTQLEYISSTSDGGQYIDLNVKIYETANSTYDLAIKFNLKGAGKDSTTQPTIFGCQKDVNPYPGTFIRKHSSKNQIQFRYIAGSNKDNYSGGCNQIIELPEQTPPNKNVYTSVGNDTHNWGTSLFCYFKNSSNTPARFGEADLYYFKLWLNGTLVRDMIPCIDPNNVVGLYDAVNGVFYSSPNGEAFVAGPEI